MNRTTLINYKGKKIFSMDFSGLSTLEEIESVILVSKDFIHNQKDKSLLTLTNMDGMHFNNEIKNVFTDFIGSNKKYVIAGGVLGLSGLLRIIYNGVNRFTGRDIKSFEAQSEALEWLITRDQSVLA